jgi:hypothetical protein
MGGFNLSTLRYEPCKENIKNVSIPLFYNLPSSKRIDSTNESNPRKYLASFVGRFFTHECRSKIRNIYKHDNRFFIIETTYYNGLHERELFQNTMKNSLFALCPRGTGVTSYRIFESIYYGAIPVYISDEFHLPFNVDFNIYGIKIELKDIDKIKEILLSYSEEKIKELRIKGNDMYEKIFNFQSTSEKIIPIINE